MAYLIIILFVVNCYVFIYQSFNRSVLLTNDSIVNLILIFQAGAEVIFISNEM